MSVGAKLRRARRQASAGGTRLGAVMRRRVEVWTTASAVLVYLLLVAVAGSYPLFSVERGVAEHLAIGVPAALLAVAADMTWKPPPATAPGLLGRRLIVYGLGGLAGTQFVSAAEFGLGTGGVVGTAAGVLALVTALVVAAGVLCGVVARGRAEGRGAREIIQRSAFVVLLLLLGVLGLQAALTVQAPSAVGQLPWLLVFGVLLAVPALVQVRGLGSQPAATLQVVAVLVAHAVGPAVAGYLERDVVAIGLVVVGVLLLLLHPNKPAFRRLHPRLSVGLGAALVGIPMAVLAVRSGVVTARVGAGVDEIVTIYAVAVVATVLIATLGMAGWRLSGATAAVAVGLFGIASVLAPAADGSWGQLWGGLAVAWAVAFTVAVFRPERPAEESQESAPAVS